MKEIREERLRKLKQLKDSGFDPYPIETGKRLEIRAVRERFSRLVAGKKKKTIPLAGRVMARRGQGAIIFLNLDDGTGAIQAMLKRGVIKESSLGLFADTVDRGDFIYLEGEPLVTNRGEKTILVRDWRMLAKSLRSLPDKWHGFKDKEERTRRRYLDLLASAETRKVFLLRTKIIQETRRILDHEGFIEVETPILQHQAGGASAEPFSTHHQSLDLTLYLRIAVELYLKQLLVGGFPAIYELGRNFRNEGVDATHNPEFTMLEFYRAFSTAEAERVFVERFIKTVAKKTVGSLVISYDGKSIDLSRPFKKVSYFDLLKQQAFISDPAGETKESLMIKAGRLGARIEDGATKEKILDIIYKKACRPKLIVPTFIVDYPANALPLAKRKTDDANLVDAWQLVVGGLELAKAFSELNDPLDQAERFRRQEEARRAGDKEAPETDQEFLEALEYGMPPAGGVGIGIDRLVMLLADTKNIRDVILFPTLRPRLKNQE